MTPIKDRLLLNYYLSGDCWIWKGKPIDKYGYMRITIGSRTDKTRKKVLVHRLSYETFVGQIPKGLTIDHLCNKPSCINPKHLKPATMWENTKRSLTSPTAVNSRKENCPKCKNAFTLKKTGGRYCRPCYLNYLRIYNSSRQLGL